MAANGPSGNSQSQQAPQIRVSGPHPHITGAYHGHFSQTDWVLLYEIDDKDVQHPEYVNRLNLLKSLATNFPHMGQVMGSVAMSDRPGKHWLVVRDTGHSPFSVDQVMKTTGAPISEAVLSGYVYGMLKVLQKLQEHNLTCTLNPEMIVIDFSGWAVLSDLRGLLPVPASEAGAPAKGGACDGLRARNTIYASPEWMRESVHEITSDNWSLGLSLLTLATGSSSFALKTAQQLRADKDQNEIQFATAQNFNRLSGLCQAFIKSCLKVSWAARVGVATLLDDQWLTDLKAQNRARWKSFGEQGGKGVYGVVFKGYEMYDGRAVPVAMKKQHNEYCTNSFERENKIHGQLSQAHTHPNLVTYKGTTTELALERGAHGFPTFVYKTVVVMEWVEKLCLRTYLADRNPFKFRLICYQLLSGLSVMHLLRVVHRDIKVDNILWDGAYAKLTDFGTAKHLENTYAHTQTGSPDHMAPEVLNVSTPATFESDIWSFAMTMIVLYGEGLWPESALPQRLKGKAAEANDAWIRNWMQEVYQHIMSPGWAYPIPDSLPTDLRGFLACCLKPRPADRPTAAVLLGHPYIQQLHAAVALQQMQQQQLQQQQQ